MSDAGTVVDQIAADLDIRRYSAEEVSSFSWRVVYSATRFWVEAFCADDSGEGCERGSVGITKQAIAIRLKRFLSSMEPVVPSIRPWLQDNTDLAREVYGRLIDIGDIVPNGFNGTYVAHTAMAGETYGGWSLVTGFLEPTDETWQGRLLMSGLATLVRNGNPDEPIRRPWWETDLDILPWTKQGDIGDVCFVSLDPKKSGWSVKKAQETTPRWSAEGLSVARLPGNHAPDSYYVAQKVGGATYLSTVPRHRAQALFQHARSSVGHPMSAVYTRLDDAHAKLFAPIGCMPRDTGRFLDAATWPMGHRQNSGDRILRIELLPFARNLLERNEIVLKEVPHAI
jgi:hypothetical protein